MNFPVFRAQELSNLTGLVSDEVGKRLAGLAHDVPRTQAVVEVGSYKGRSTCYLAEGARLGGNAHVYAVDPWDLPGNPTGKHRFAEPFTREAFRVQVHSMSLDEYITPIQDFSLRAAERWDGPPIGLLYIDGSHTYTDVWSDYEAWNKHLATRATVVFDDYDTPRNPGVKEYVDELRILYDFDIDTPPLAIRCLR